MVECNVDASWGPSIGRSDKSKICQCHVNLEQTADNDNARLDLQMDSMEGRETCAHAAQP